MSTTSITRPIINNEDTVTTARWEGGNTITVQVRMRPGFIYWERPSLPDIRKAVKAFAADHGLELTPKRRPLEWTTHNGWGLRYSLDD